MGQAKVEQVTATAQAAWLNMLDVDAKASFGIKAQQAAADETLACPEAIGVAEGVISVGNAIFLRRSHLTERSCSYWCGQYSVDHWSAGGDFPDFWQGMPDTIHRR